jgi:hypothetical protein
MIQSLTGLVLGLMIGVGFGMVQDTARRRNEKRQQTGDLKTPWMVMPGSGVRVAYLLVALVVIQIVCPLLFRDGVQWWVSGGVAGGYGLMLFLRLRERMSRNR